MAKRKKRRRRSQEQQHEEEGTEEDRSADLRLEAIQVKVQQLRWYLKGQLDILTDILTESETFLEAHP